MSEGIAIVGLAATFPGAPDVEQFWRNIRAGVSAICQTPSSRWAASYYDPTSRAVDRFYCRRGGFLPDDLSVDPSTFGVMPIAAQGAEPDQLLTLRCASQALRDAGFDDSRVSRQKTGVILGRGGYLGPGLARVDQSVRVAETVAQSLRRLVPQLPEADIQAVKEELQREAGPYGPDTAVGLVPNLAASRISNRFNLGGPSYTVDAACASSLLAVDQACRELKSGRCDFMLAGGVHICHDVTLWSVFTQLGALSRREQIRPFDRHADGLLIGEGVGLLALRRLSDAQRDGDRVYAVIRGTGVSSDGHGASLMSPSPEGQREALGRAWDMANLEPNSLGLLEAHGTGTPVGDQVEMQTLDQFFGRRFARGPVIGSVKSMIGHTMPAAGAAGLIKAALAIHHETLPPTLGIDEPIEILRQSAFRPLGEATAWNANRRRAGVNAFGFGGINAHVVIENAPQPEQGKVVSISAKTRHAKPAPLPESASKLTLLRVAAENSNQLLERLASGRSGGEGSHRLVILNPNEKKLERAQAIVEQGDSVNNARGGIWYSPAAAPRDSFKVAFLFPGVDSSFDPQVDDLEHCFERQATHIDGRLDPATAPLEKLGLSIIHLNRFLHHTLADFGIEADLFAGHSIGEWSAMIASGMIPEDTVDPFIQSLVGTPLDVPEVIYAAIGCDVERAEERIAHFDDVELSHDNCPHQVIICGGEASIETLVDQFIEDGILCQRLPFRSGFHSSNLLGYLSAHREALARLPMTAPAKPLFSATRCTPYPSHPDEVRELAIEHLVNPVRFRGLIHELYERGTRLFIQCGTGSLVGFISDTLRGRPHGVVAANDPRRSGLEQLVRLMAIAWTTGVDVGWDRLPLRGAVASVSTCTPLKLGAPTAKLSLKLPPLDLQPKRTPLGLSDPIQEAYQGVLDAIAEASEEAVKAWSGAGSSPIAPRIFKTRQRLSPEIFPAVMDHCFYRQPQGWSDISDRFPVIPMTTSIELMRQVAQSLVPNQVLTRIEDVRAWQWLVVDSEVEVDVVAQVDEAGRVEVEISDFASAAFVFAPEYGQSPALPLRLEASEVPGPTDALRLYEDRWMFHGPQFQCIERLGGLRNNGIEGTLRASPTPGALLDNAGQLFGYWVMATNEDDRLAMPMKIDRIHFFASDPPTDESLTCRVLITEQREETVSADLDLEYGGRVWARIEGWHDRRFESDEDLWKVLQFPERNAVGTQEPGGYCRVESRWKSSASRDLIARRFLGRTEREDRERLGLRKRHAWLLGRMAAKDAARHWLWSRGHGDVFPVEVQVSNDESGRPRLRLPGESTLDVSIAHKEGIAVALVSEVNRVGIDVEKVAERGEDFERIAFTEAERRLLPRVDRTAWVTRFWVGKEAVAKAIGTGLRGNPQTLEVTDLTESHLIVNGHRVSLHQDGDHIIGWVEIDPATLTENSE